MVVAWPAESFLAFLSHLALLPATSVQHFPCSFYWGLAVLFAPVYPHFSDLVFAALACLFHSFCPLPDRPALGFGHLGSGYSLVDKDKEHNYIVYTIFLINI